MFSVGLPVVSRPVTVCVQSNLKRQWLRTGPLMTSQVEVPVVTRFLKRFNEGGVSALTELIVLGVI